MIPVSKPQYDQRDEKLLNEVISSGYWVKGGNFVEILEKEFAEYVGVKHAIAVSSWPIALYLVLKKSYIRIEVLKIPTCTYVGIINAVKQANCRYRLTDDIFVGKPYQIQPLGIWDCSYEIKRDQKITTAVYSFYPTRQIASFDGGMIVTNSDEGAEWYRRAKMGGIKEDVYSWEYEVEFAGYRADMTEAQAALALSQLRKIDENNEKRANIVREYNERLGEKNSSLTIFPILVKDEESRQKFADFAKDKGFEVSVHFRPLHWLKAYKILRYRYPFPKSDEWGGREVSLPFYPDMTKQDIDTVCKAVLEWREHEAG